MPTSQLRVSLKRSPSLRTLGKEMKKILIIIALFIFQGLEVNAEPKSKLIQSLDKLRSELMSSEDGVPTLLEKYKTPSVPQELSYAEKYILYRTLVESYCASQIRHNQGYYIKTDSDIIQLTTKVFPNIGKLYGEGGQLIYLGDIELYLRKVKIKQDA